MNHFTYTVMIKKDKIRIKELQNLESYNRYGYTKND